MLKGYIFLLGAAMFWGITFIPQKTSMEAMGPFSFTGIRFLIGGGILLFYKLLISTSVFNFFNKSKNLENQIVDKDTNKISVKAWCKALSFLGMIVFVGINLQQIGLQFTIPTHAALLTTTYVFLVPIFLLFTGEKIRKQVWFIGLIIFVGIFLLTVNVSNLFSGGGAVSSVSTFSLIGGDIITLGSAFFWALHIIFLERYLKKGFSPLDLVVGQSLVVGVVSLLVAVVIESPSWSLLISHPISFVVGGVFSVSLAFLLQVKGQQIIRSSIATLLLSTESLFATFADFLWLDQVLSLQAYIGALLILGGVILIQVWHLVSGEK